MYFLYYGGNSAFWPLMSLYFQQAGLSGLQIGTLASVRPTVVLLSQPLWGMAADLWSRRRMLLLTLFFSSLLALGFVWNGGFPYFLALAAIFMLVQAPAGSLIDSLTLDHLDEHGDRSFGEFRAWGSIGWGFVSVATGCCVAEKDLRLTFVVGTVILLAAWAVVKRFTGEEPTRIGLRRRWEGVRVLLRRSGLPVFLGLAALLHMGSAGVYAFYAIYMKEIGARAGVIGVAMGLRGLGEIPVFLGAAALFRRVEPRKTIAVACACRAAQALLYSVIRVPGLAAATELLHAFSFGLLMISAVEYIDAVVGGEWRATGQALYSAVGAGAGGVVGGAWAGFLVDRIGTLGMFRVNGFLMLGVAAVAAVVLNRLGKRGEESGQTTEAGCTP